VKRSRASVALVLGATLFALVCGEVFVRTVAPQELGIWDSTRDGLTIHVPNITQHLAQFNQTVSTNSFGMRDREHTIENVGEAYRILLLGDSFMEAVQVPFAESFPFLLERRLSQIASRKIEVINASVSGWGTDDELTYLTRYGRAFQPDLVLVAMTLHNDVSDNLVEEFHEFKGGGLREKPRQDIPLSDYTVLQVKAFLASHSHMAQLIHKFLRRSYVQTAATSLRNHVAELIMQPPSTEIASGWQMTQRLFEKTRAVAKDAGAELVIFMLPLAIQTSDIHLEQFLRSQGLEKNHIDVTAPQQVMQQWSRQSGIPVIDLLPNFRAWIHERGDTLFLENDGHWTKDGHHVAAETVADYLMQGPLRDGQTQAGPAQGVLVRN